MDSKPVNAVSQHLESVVVDRTSTWPEWLSLEMLAEFLHENMEIFEKPIPVIEADLKLASAPGAGRGGLVLVAHSDHTIVGAIVIVKTALVGSLAENQISYLAVSPQMRGLGISRSLLKRAIGLCKGELEAHIEYGNPARRVYEELGFVNSYVDLRFSR